MENKAIKFTGKIKNVDSQKETGYSEIVFEDVRFLFNPENSTEAYKLLTQEETVEITLKPLKRI